MPTRRVPWLSMAILLSAVWLGSGLVTVQALQVGDKAPDFALSGTTAEGIQLADYLGKKSLVLFFYVGAFVKG